MFLKKLTDRKTKHFKWAPPTTNLDDISDDRLPEPPYAGVPRQERSAYFYWWAFLRENEDYIACCNNRGKGPKSELYEEFGDVRDDDFFAWWIQTGRALFCERDEFAVRLHDTLPTDHDFNTELLVSIPLTGNTRLALDELERKMNRMFARAGTSKHVQLASTARCKMWSKPVISTLHERLSVWRLSERYRKEGQNVPQYLWADELKMSISKGRTDNDSDARSIKASVVNRALKEAKNLIHNVAEGRFPDMSTPEEKVIAARLRREAIDARRNNETLEPSPRNKSAKPKQVE